jgi:subtilase family serine protease
MNRIFTAALAAAGGMLWAAAAFAQAAPAVEHSGRTFHVAVCPGPAGPGTARCHAHIVTDSRGVPIVFGKPSPNSATAAPYNAQALWSAYYHVTTMPTGASTVAIVDAYGYSNAASDLATYRAANGLPPLCSSTVTTGCVTFTKLNQNGVAGSYPRPNTGWAEESALDLDMVSALCPQCNIILVEASSANFNNLATAEVTASKQPNVIAVSNSYGGSEGGSSSYVGSYSPQGSSVGGVAGKIPDGVAITVSSGDSGFSAGAQFPASAPYVVAVGGTSLTLSGGTWSQSAWNKAGSGCSSTYPQQGWQSPVLPVVSGGCAKRMVADVSAVADPNTGVLVVFNGNNYQFGGTSVSAPLIAGIIGQTGVREVTTTGYAPVIYSNASQLYDVTTGSNGSCTVAYFCTAGVGYDGPTGMGTPNGPTTPF